MNDESTLTDGMQLVTRRFRSFFFFFFCEICIFHISEGRRQVTVHVSRGPSLLENESQELRERTGEGVDEVGADCVSGSVFGRHLEKCFCWSDCALYRSRALAPGYGRVLTYIFVDLW